MRLNYRFKLLLFFLVALAVFLAFPMGYAALSTLSRLEVVEAERDQWQRPSAVIDALDLRPGSIVVDLGCGSGYFTWKLSSRVGDSGRVIAEDIRSLPLLFLWFRTVLKRGHNVRIVHGEPSNPHLPQRVNGVLIANTYHELADARAILVHVYQSLAPGGQLVVVDRAMSQARNAGIGGHEITVERVEQELRQAHFDIVRRQDAFIEKDPDQEAWWLIVARKPH